MSFIAKNPLSLPVIDYTPSTPPGTRGFIAKEDGLYQVDSKKNEEKIATAAQISELKYYDDVGVTPSPVEWFDVTINEDNTCIITGLSGVWMGLSTYDYAFHIVIPYEIEGNKVVGIKRDAFAEVGLNSVVLPNTITSIGDSAFYYNNFKSIIIPDSVTEIGNGVFSKCTNLTHVSIPNTINNIDLFNHCDKLTHINIPNSVTSIGMMSFFNCAGLTHVDIPNSVTIIKEEAFNGCTNLKTINIPDSVTTIEYYAIPSTTKIICSKGSYAETYAKENGYEYIYDMIMPSDYVDSLSINNNTMTITKGDGSTSELNLPTGGSGGSIIVDEALDSRSTNPVQNKVVTNWITVLNNDKAFILHKHKIADLEDYVVDEVLDATSVNPVQNKHIAFHISELMNADSELTLRIDNEIGSIEEKISKKLDSDKVDATLDISSTNPVQNKVVANELNEKISDAAIMADRYLILYKLNGTNIELEVATPTYVDNQIGLIETALDNIIAIQNSLIGGDSV